MRYKKLKTNQSKINGLNNMAVRIMAFIMLAQAVSTLHAGMSSTTQTITLKPGWNAIYVELEPNNNDIKQIFSGIPVKSVWRWMPKGIGKDFIKDPSEGLLSVDGWFGYYPEPRPEAFLSNLYTISANTAYLVNLDAQSNKTISITGIPKLKPKKWVSNGYTLTGLSVNPTNQPSFGDYFESSDAHQGQAIYKLSQTGQWQMVNNSFVEEVQSGEAYWFYTDGVSKYQGLLNLRITQGDSMEFRSAFTEMNVILSNISGVTNFVTLNRVDGVKMPMKFLNIDPETDERAWPDLPVNKVFELEPGEDLFLTLAVDRLNFQEERMEQVFSITNEQGVRVLMHAGANTIQPLTLPTRNRNKTAVIPDSYAGLWIGTARVKAVSESQLAGVTPTKVAKPFSLRVLIHVDASGQVRILKNVVQMWQDGTYTVSAENPDYLEVETPGHYVLLTDDLLIPNFSGITRRGGQSAGVRYSTIAYDYVGNEMDMDGAFEPASQVSVTLLLDSEMPTNPFYHKYHPDHDNLDAQFLNYKQEAFQVTREIEFGLTLNNPQYPDVADSPGWGVEEMGGVYRETITGLHKNAIFVEGDFRLRRVASTALLNQ